ncbi:hypothetical protein COSO111634_33270 [Corallococcus soli]
MRLGVVLWMCFGAVGCTLGPRQFPQLRQSTGMGPGPGPGCVSTLDCQCKDGVVAACEQLATAPRPRMPPPLPPPGAAEEAREKETERRRDTCGDDYVRCVDAGGGGLPGRVEGESRCDSCRAYCMAHGFWPTSIYTWNGRPMKCPGK